ncbi:hypothetical protein [Halorubrum luteum]
MAGLGTGAFGSVSLVGSGAFSRITTRQETNIKIADDSDALLGLGECPELDAEAFEGEIDVEFDDNLKIEGEPPADNVTWFDNVFEICNQGKEDVGVWIEAEDDLGLSDDDDEDRDRLWFYEEDEREQSRVDSIDDAFRLEVGVCKCIGIRVNAEDREETQQFKGEIVINADVSVDAEEE